MNHEGFRDPTAEIAIRRGTDRKMNPKDIYKKFCAVCPDIAKRCVKFTTSSVGNQIILTMDNKAMLRFVIRKTGWRLESYGF